MKLFSKILIAICLFSEMFLFNAAVLAETPSAAGLTTEQIQEVAKDSLNPMNLTDAADVIGRGVRLLMAFIGSISLALYIWAGILWMTAAGNADRAGQGKTIIIWTTLGIVVMLSSYVIVGFVFSLF